jgi:low temperature requirement protein LtrA
MPSPLRRHPAEDDSPARASFVELFFDLVFVLAVTQLSSVLIEDLTVAGAAETLFLLLAAWWAWIYTTWMTNWFDPETRPVRAILLMGMLASLFGAIAIPEAFGDRAGLFVVGYVGIQLVRNAFMVVATKRSDPLHAPLVRIFVWSAWVSMIWLAGALVEGDARIAVWIVALVLDYAGPLAGHWAPGLGRSVPADWELVPSHFSERIALFVIIALGETIVAAGVTAADLEMNAARIAAVVVSFGISVAFWWLYFDYHAEGAARELESPARRRAGALPGRQPGLQGQRPARPVAPAPPCRRRGLRRHRQRSVRPGTVGVVTRAGRARSPGALRDRGAQTRGERRRVGAPAFWCAVAALG